MVFWQPCPLAVDGHYLPAMRSLQRRRLALRVLFCKHTTNAELPRHRR
ncbi:hypothetical protein ACRYCC_15235 [Actinomadura scrupuli]